MKFTRDENGQYATDMELDFKNTNVIKFVHNKQTIATYHIKKDILTFKQASENYLVDEKMYQTILQALNVFNGKENES